MSDRNKFAPTPAEEIAVDTTDPLNPIINPTKGIDPRDEAAENLALPDHNEGVDVKHTAEGRILELHRDNEALIKQRDRLFKRIKKHKKKAKKAIKKQQLLAELNKMRSKPKKKKKVKPDPPPVRNIKESDEHKRRK